MNEIRKRINKKKFAINKDTGNIQNNGDVKSNITFKTSHNTKTSLGGKCYSDKKLLLQSTPVPSYPVAHFGIENLNLHCNDVTSVGCNLKSTSNTKLSVNSNGALREIFNSEKSNSAQKNVWTTEHQNNKVVTSSTQPPTKHYEAYRRHSSINAKLMTQSQQINCSTCSITPIDVWQKIDNTQQKNDTEHKQALNNNKDFLSISAQQLLHNTQLHTQVKHHNDLYYYPKEDEVIIVQKEVISFEDEMNEKPKHKTYSTWVLDSPKNENGDHKREICMQKDKNYSGTNRKKAEENEMIGGGNDSNKKNSLVMVSKQRKYCDFGKCEIKNISKNDIYNNSHAYQCNKPTFKNQNGVYHADEHALNEPTKAIEQTCVISSQNNNNNIEDDDVKEKDEFLDKKIIFSHIKDVISSRSNDEEFANLKENLEKKTTKRTLKTFVTQTDDENFKRPPSFLSKKTSYHGDEEEDEDLRQGNFYIETDDENEDCYKINSRTGNINNNKITKNNINNHKTAKNNLNDHTRHYVIKGGNTEKINRNPDGVLYSRSNEQVYLKNSQIPKSGLYVGSEVNMKYAENSLKVTDKPRRCSNSLNLRTIEHINSFTRNNHNHQHNDNNDDDFMNDFDHVESWREAARVLDRLFFWILFALMTCSSTLILLFPTYIANDIRNH